VEYFTEAKTVEEGEALSSFKYNAFAHAINSRLRSCIGDGPWRVAWHLYSLMRRLCYSDDYEIIGQNNLFPWDAFFRWFQHVSPDQPVPEQPPGQVGGLATDTVQPMATFINGIGQDVAPEPERAEPCPPAFKGDTPTQKWSRFKSQRGYIVDGQELDRTRVPALELGFWIDDIENGINRQISHVESGYGAWANTTGVPLLQKTKGRTLSRSANAFVREFRGSDAQRNDTEEWPEGYHVQAAANWTDVLTNQLLTAPQYAAPGTTQGEYATWEILGTSIPAGTTIPQTVGGVPYSTPAGFLTTHGIVRATNLVEACTVLLRHADGEIPVTLDDDAGKIFKLPIAAYRSITVELPDGAELQAPGGDIHLELNAIMEYKPQVRDLYVLARLSATNNTVPDGRGTREVYSREFVEDYLAYGGIVNQHDIAGIPTNPDGVANQNAVYEAAREMTQFVRILPGFGTSTNKNNFIAMERAFEPTAEDPNHYRNSIWMLRNDPEVVDGGDAFLGVAPIVKEAGEAGYSNEWMCGVQLKPYTNSESSVYKKEGFPSMMAFFDRATYGLRLNVPSNPDILAYYKHMCASAGALGEMATRPENPTVFRYAPKKASGDTSGGYFNEDAATGGNTDFLKSCRVYEPDLEIEHIEEYPSESLDLVDENGDVLIDDLGDELVTEVAPGQVRIDFASRWQSTSGEPGGAPDVYPWYAMYQYENYWADLRIENDTLYRTTENGLRSFLFYAWSLDNPVNGQQLTQEPTVGDGAYGNEIYQSGGGANRGCTMPHFYFVKLMPLVFADGNTNQNWGIDTHFVHDPMLQGDLYLRAMCEGFLRGVNNNPCDDVPKLAEYTYEQLVSDADETGRALTFMPSAPDEATAIMNERWVREDPGWGAGPLPYTYHDARRFNLFVRAVNLLRRARLPWPIDVLFADAQFETDRDSMQPLTGSRGESCFDGDIPVVQTSGANGPDVDWNNPVVEWGESPYQWVFDAFNSPIVAGDRCWIEVPDKSTQYGVYSHVWAFRWRITNTTAFYDALPPAIRNMVTGNQSGLAARVEKILNYHTFQWTTTPGDVTPGWEYGGGTGYDVSDEIQESYSTTCSVMTSGSYAPPTPPQPTGASSGIGREYYSSTQDGCIGPTHQYKVEVAQHQSLILEPGILPPEPEP